MSKCRYLTGANVKPSGVVAARSLIGCKVQYLRKQDIDRSGRGYLFPQSGSVSEAFRRTIVIGGEYIYLSDIVELVKLAAD